MHFPDLPVDGAPLLAFVATAVFTVVSPGPDTLLILRITLSGGRPSGLAAVAGVQSGLCVHTFLAAVGLSLLIASSPVLFRGIGIAGALYIGWLGVSGFRSGDLRVNTDANGIPSGYAPFRAYRDAAIVNILNPKVIILYLALFPHFMDPAKGHIALQGVFLGAVLIVINTFWQVPLVYMAEAARRWLLTPAIARTVARGVGLVFIAIAAALLYEHVT